MTPANELARSACDQINPDLPVRSKISKGGLFLDKTKAYRARNLAPCIRLKVNCN